MDVRTGPPGRLVLGSIHCHSTFSDGAGTPTSILARAGAAGLDFLAITDHLPWPTFDRAPRAGFAAEFPPAASGVVRLPGVEYSPPQNHYLVLGADPWEVPHPSTLPGWPHPSAYVGANAGRPDRLGFVAHPDDEGNSFLRLQSYRWTDWTVSGCTGLEVWNLSTDLARTVQSYRDALKALLAGLYRAVPPPHPRTLARWDQLAQRGKVVGIAGTDAHAHPVRWHGLPLTVVPYERAFGTLQTAVWVDPDTADGPPRARIAGILDGLRRGRTFMVNRVWGHPLDFAFQARTTRRPDRHFVAGDLIPSGCPVRFEVKVPSSAWIRLLRNGMPVANTYGRELNLEPLDTGIASAGEVQEAWRVEVWACSNHWSRAGSGFFPWILSNHIYRALG